MNSYDIAIIGAGAAGMSAAITATQYGASVAILDEKPQAGGQIYRNVVNSPLDNPKILGEDYIKGKTLVEAFNQCGVQHYREAKVWHVGDTGEVLFSKNNATQRLTTRELLLTTGAMERPFPVTGWHLPGVMSAGSAQVMLKSDGVVYEGAVFVGTGALLYLIVAQYIRLGVKVAAVIDTTPKRNYLRALPYLAHTLTEYKLLFKGLNLLKEIRQANIPVYHYAHDVEIMGTTHAAGVRFVSKGKQHTIETDHVFLHQGVIPNLNISRALGMTHHWSEQQLCWAPTLNKWGQSSIDMISVAGDGQGIIGADGAVIAGQLSALNQLYRLGFISKKQRDQEARGQHDALHGLHKFRRFLDTLYRPIATHRIPSQDDVVVCRCEEQTVAQLKKGFEQGARDPNQLKSLTRCGMGACQGRQCGHTISELLATWRQESVENIGYYRLRSPMRLVNLTELGQFTVPPSSTTSQADSNEGVA